MRFITLVLLFLVNFCYAEKLSLMCNAFDIRKIFSSFSEFNKPLKSGEVRFINQTLAGFLNSDDYSIGVTQECEGKKNRESALLSETLIIAPNLKKNSNLRKLALMDP